MKVPTIAIVTLMLASLALPSPAAVKGAKPMPLTPGWTNDFEAARKQAEAENKQLLIEFTGSDWCGPCIMLKKTILSKEEFIKGMKPHFVLVQLDFPGINLC